MPTIVTMTIVGIVAGIVATLAMTLWQGATASLFGMGGGNADPSNVKAADSVSEAIEGRPVTQKHRAAAGSAMHYALGIALGLIYAWLVATWPIAGIGFGAGFGIATMLLLDYLLVPVMGWGPWPTAAIGSNLYSLTAHLVFGVAIEAVRRIGFVVLG